MCFKINFLPAASSYLQWTNRTIFVLLVIALINFLSEGKEFGRSSIIAKYSSNYQFNCTSSGCDVAPESRTSLFGIEPQIKREALTEYLEIPFIDDLWPKKLCATILTAYKPKELTVNFQFSSNSGTGVSTFGILEGKKTCIKYNSEEKIDSIKIDLIKPEFEYLTQKVGEFLSKKSEGQIDDQERFFEVRFRIEYENKFLALTFIWLFSLFIALKLTKTYIKLRDELINFLETGGEPADKMSDK